MRNISRVNKIGILQGRLTPSNGRGLQFFPEDNWMNEFIIAKKIGFSHIELLIRNDKTLVKNPLMNPEKIGMIKDLAYQSGITIDSIHAFCPKNDFQKIFTRLITNSNLIGAKTILVPFFNDNALINKEKKTEAKGSIASILPICEKLNIRLGIETELNTEELLDFISSFWSPFIGIYYDIGNMASIGANTASDIRIINNLLFGIHIKDRLANGGETVPIGSGCVKFKETLSAINEIGYNGPMIIHGARKDGMDDVKLNSDYLNYIQHLI